VVFQVRKNADDKAEQVNTKDSVCLKNKLSDDHPSEDIFTK
jgi:hypothetical protein